MLGIALLMKGAHEDAVNPPTQFGGAEGTSCSMACRSRGVGISRPHRGRAHGWTRLRVTALLENIEKESHFLMVNGVRPRSLPDQHSLRDRLGLHGRTGIGGDSGYGPNAARLKSGLVFISFTLTKQ